MPAAAVYPKPTFPVDDILYTPHPECGKVMRSSPNYTSILQNLNPGSVHAQVAGTHSRVNALWHNSRSNDHVIADILPINLPALSAFDSGFSWGFSVPLLI